MKLFMNKPLNYNYKKIPSFLLRFLIIIKEYNMKKILTTCLLILLTIFFIGCVQKNEGTARMDIKAEDILGNADYLAMSYGGYRFKTRDSVPTVEQLKEDMKILAVLGIKLIRTYNTHHYAQAANLLKAIRELKNEDPNFEMYVMLGTWIECEGAWTSTKNHNAGNVANNTAEIETAIVMANEFPDIVKIIAVGNESMVQWAVGYFVYPNIILKWVEHLQNLKKSGGIPKDIWITSSDNYESWGGGSSSYQTDELTALIKAVDFVSLHTYPFHDSYYEPNYWGIPENEENLSDKKKIDAAMIRAIDYAKSQYMRTADYIAGLGINKPIHIGETGWATVAGTLYGSSGSHAADEYKEKIYHDHMRAWTNNTGISCFYFKIFDENWKDARNELGSENHFGMINLKGEAKYTLWDMVDKGTFDGLTRDGNSITKTYNGDESLLMKDVLLPPTVKEIGILETNTVNNSRKTGTTIIEGIYVVVSESLIPDSKNNMTYPSDKLKLTAFDGTCGMKMSEEKIITVQTGTGNWWGCALQIKSEGISEDLSKFASGHLNFEIKGNTTSTVNIGFQTGFYSKGTQVDNYVIFGPNSKYPIIDNWVKYSIPISEIDKDADLTKVTSMIYFKGDSNFDGKNINIKNIYYTQ